MPEKWDRLSISKPAESTVMVSRQQAQKLVEEAKQRFPIHAGEEYLIVTYAHMYDDPDLARHMIQKLEQAIHDADPVAAARTLQEAQDQIDRLPDRAIGLSDMHEYGYRKDDMYPMSQDKALEMHRLGFKVYCLQPDGTAGTFSSREMIEEHNGIFGIRKADWDYELEHLDDEYGEDMAYLYPPMSGLEKDEALRLFDAGETIYLVTTNLIPVAATIRLEIEYGSDYFQIPTEALENVRHLQTEMQEHPVLQSLREAKLLLESEDRYGVYQLRIDSPVTEELLFQSMDALQRLGASVEWNNYHLVYTEHLYPADTLESIYARFNQDRQPDVDGPSLNVSDVIVMNRDGMPSTYYVNNLGFQELPDCPPQIAVSERLKENEVLYPSDGPIMMDSKGIEVEGHEGTGHPGDVQEVNGRQFVLLEHDTYGDSVAKVIVDDDGPLCAEDLWNGVDEGAKKAIAECCIDAGLPITPDLLFGDRYTAIETSDAFEEPFAVYDKLTAQYYSLDGVVQTFDTLEAAQDSASALSGQYRAEVSEEVDEHDNDQDRGKAAKKPHQKANRERQSVLQALRSRQAKQKAREQAEKPKRVQTHKQGEHEL